MGGVRKRVRIKRWRESWYVVFFDETKGKEVRRACTSYKAYTPAERAHLLKVLREHERRSSAERIRHGTGIAYDTPLVQAVDDFLSDVDQRAAVRKARPDSREGISAASAHVYHVELTDFRRWVTTHHPGLTTGQLDGRTLQSYLANLALTPASNGRMRSGVTLNKYRRHLKACLSWLSRQRPRLFPELDILKHALKPARTKVAKGVAYTPPQLRAFRAALPPDVRRLFDLVACTGMRRGEALALTWDQVDLERGRIFVTATKTGMSRIVPLTGAPEGEVAPKLLRAMRKWKTSPTVVGLDDFPRELWDTAVQVSGVKIACQGLRKNFVSYSASMGVPASVCAMWTGHSAAVAEQFYRLQTLERLRARSIQAAMGL